MKSGVLKKKTKMSYIQNQTTESNGAKKSLYVFLCALLGALIFLIIHRLLVFAYLLLATASPEIFYGKVNYLGAVAADFFTLILVLLLGVWYGIWLGLRWYEAIYERGEYGGFVDHVVNTYWHNPKIHYNLHEKVESVARELKEDVLELEHLTKIIKPVIRSSPPIKRRIVRKKIGRAEKKI